MMLGWAAALEYVATLSARLPAEMATPQAEAHSNATENGIL